MLSRPLIAICIVLFAAASSVSAQNRGPKSGVVFDIPRVSQITVDGASSDWGREGLHVDALADLGALYRTGGDGPPEASARIGWDARGVLALIHVKDRTPEEYDNPGQLYVKDSVELSVMDRTHGRSRYLVIVSPGADPKHPTLRMQKFDYRASTLHPLEMQIATTHDKDGYTVEALLPWANLQVTPTVGKTVDLQITVNNWRADNREQRAWRPAEDDSIVAEKMQTVRLSVLPSPPIRVAGIAVYNSFRWTDFALTAPAALAGKPVAIKDGPKTVAAMVLGRQGDQAAAKLRLPCPAPGTKSYGPLTIVLEGVPQGVMLMPDLKAARRNVAQQLLMKSTFTFSGEWFPEIDYDQPRGMEDAIGPYTLRTTWYDNDYRRVTQATKPGRYGARVEIVGKEGVAAKRFLIFFRQPSEIDWANEHLTYSPKIPTLLGIEEPIARSYATDIDEQLSRAVSDAFQNRPGFAALYAQLYETKSATPLRDPWTASDVWAYGLKKRTGDAVPYPYLAWTPDGYDKDASRWPLLLFLHGAGERGTDLDLVKRHGPPMLADGGRKFPFLVIAPQCPEDEGWNPAQVKDLLDTVSAKYRVDPDRIYVTGLSMGGNATWTTAEYYPDLFAALAPMATDGDPRLVGPIAHIPTWAFHSAGDSLVPVEGAQAMVDAMRKAGGDVQFTVYPSASHNSWAKAYESQELYDWMLKQRRAKPEAGE
ncbi:MAG: PHB depolymerase family esterase [Capsulimonas sp.]|uniref:sugar-binding protein n=1 Tax=Capsulimonas sp. TaxID=2494211 RepID=UPI0032640D0E